MQWILPMFVGARRILCRKKTAMLLDLLSLLSENDDTFINIFHYAPDIF